MDYLGRLLLSVFLLSWDGKLFQVSVEMSSRLLLLFTERASRYLLAALAVSGTPLRLCVYFKLR